jgi:predicted PhzF superfamily epimerase YddE/YHI9
MSYENIQRHIRVSVNMWAAAAALGGYLRAAELIPAPTTILIRQGEAMGRPSQLLVHIPVSGGIVVTGKAIRI